MKHLSLWKSTLFVLLIGLFFGLNQSGAFAQDVQPAHVEEKFVATAQDFAYSLSGDADPQCYEKPISASAVMTAGEEITASAVMTVAAPAEDFRIDVRYVRPAYYCLLTEDFPPGSTSENALVNRKQILAVREMRVFKMWTDSTGTPLEILLGEINVYIPVGRDEGGILGPDMKFGAHYPDTLQGNWYWTTASDGTIIPSEKVASLSHLLAANYAMILDRANMAKGAHPAVPTGKVLLATLPNRAPGLTISMAVTCPEVGGSYVILNPDQGAETRDIDGLKFIFRATHEWFHYFTALRGLDVREEPPRYDVISNYSASESFAEWLAWELMGHMANMGVEGRDLGFGVLLKFSMFEGFEISKLQQASQKILLDSADYYARQWSFGSMEDPYLFFPQIRELIALSGNFWGDILKALIEGDCYTPWVSETLGKANGKVMNWDQIVNAQIGSVCFNRQSRLFTWLFQTWNNKIRLKMSQNCKYLGVQDVSPHVLRLAMGFRYACIDIPSPIRLYRITAPATSSPDVKDLGILWANYAQDFGPDNIIYITWQDAVQPGVSTDLDLSLAPIWADGSERIVCLIKSDWAREVEFRLTYMQMNLPNKLYLPVVTKK